MQPKWSAAPLPTTTVPNGPPDMFDEMGEDILPAEYGGTNRTVEELTMFWEEELTRHTPWLLAQRDFRTDESVRVGKSKLQSMLSCSIM